MGLIKNTLKIIMRVKTLVVVGGINVKMRLIRNTFAMMIKRAAISILVLLEIARKVNL